METEKISVKERLSYGLGDLASNIGFGALAAFITYYYTNVAGIAVGTVGLILLVSKLFDGVSDIGIGILVDKTNTKYGKARPWILWMALPFAICLTAVFAVPNISQNGKAIYAFITYTLFVAGIYTAINIPYGAMTALMTQDQNERTILNIFRMGLAMIGTMVVSVITLPVVEALGNDSAAWTKTFAIYGVIAFVLFMICFKNTKERVEVQSKDKEVSSKETIKALFKNNYWYIMVGAQFVSFIGQGLTAGNIYYFEYNMGNRDLYSMSMMFTFIPLIIGIVVLSAPLAKKFGKRNTALIGNVITLIGAIVVLFGPTSVTIVFAATAIKGLGMGLLLGVLGAMTADTIEYGEWKTGIRSEGLTYSAASFGGKVGAGIGGGLMGLILSMGGYVELSATQPDSALAAIQFMFIYMPIIFAIIQILLMVFYKLDNQYPSIMEELNNRKKDAQNI